MYVIVASKARDMIVSNNFNKLYRFIVNHHNVKIKTIVYPGETRILRKQKFLTEYYIATKETTLLFDLVEILLKGRSNQKAYISSLNLDRQYKIYEDEQKTI